jgi:TPP-dependent pyruvate/acetoin dehydrogenase alpha subunit
VLENLPLVLVCENNLYSVNSPLSVRQPPGRAIAGLATGHGMESHAGDGNDVLAVRALAAQAVEKARAGDGPTFIELATYRWREHCGPNYDNDLGYRDETEYLAWRELCPVETYVGVLTRDGDLGEGDDASMSFTIDNEIDAAVDFAKSSPFPDPKTAYDHVFAESESRP